MKHPIYKHIRTIALVVALLFVFFIGMESVAMARAGSGRSSGTSRGFSSSPSRSAPSGSYSRPQTSTPQQMSPMQTRPPSATRSFLSGLGGGLVGGMLGSMLFGGHGHSGYGGYSGGGGFGFGDLIFLVIILGIIYYVVKKFRARRQGLEFSSTTSTFGSGYGNNTGYSPSPEPAYMPPQEDPVSAGLRHISDMDPSFDESRFKELVEDNFFKIQGAWTRRDLSTIRNLLTSQMYNTFQEDISRYITNKEINRLENIAVRQVEIVDAVQDQGEEYITVKFLASLLDYTVDDATNQVKSGSNSDPVKFLEYWTWTRKIGERMWILAGITQEGQ